MHIKLLIPWVKNNKEKVKKFSKGFTKRYNTLAIKLNLNKIEEK